MEGGGVSVPGLESWGIGVVWSTYRSAATGALLPGNVTVELPLRLVSPTEDAIIPAGVLINKQPLSLFGAKSFEITLPASSDPDISPNDWGYTITVVLDSGITEVFRNVFIPEGDSVSLIHHSVGV